MAWMAIWAIRMEIGGEVSVSRIRIAPLPEKFPSCKE
jgi:hypothetical protein